MKAGRSRSGPFVAHDTILVIDNHASFWAGVAAMLVTASDVVAVLDVPFLNNLAAVIAEVDGRAGIRNGAGCTDEMIEATRRDAR